MQLHWRTGTGIPNLYTRGAYKCYVQTSNAGDKLVKQALDPPWLSILSSCNGYHCVMHCTLRRPRPAITLHQGLSIHKTEAIDLVFIRPVVQGVQYELTHHGMPTIEHPIVTVVGGSIQASQ